MQSLMHISAARYALALMIALFAAAPVAVASYPYTEFAVPGANGTEIQGISGSTIYGDYLDANSAYHGFVLNNGQLTTFNAPQAGSGGQQGTVVTGISGTAAVGFFVDSSGVYHGFTESGGDYSTFDDPSSANGTLLYGIDGQNLIGTSGNSSGIYGFLYNGSGFTSIIDPLGPTETRPFAISGSTVVGYYVDSKIIYHGFVFDGANYTTIDDPSAGNVSFHGVGTMIRAIDGTKLLGGYIDSNLVIHGLIYDGNSFETVDYSSTYTLLTGESGNMLVGIYYNPDSSVPHSFIATAPEPSMMGIVFLGGSLLALRRRRISR